MSCIVYREPNGSIFSSKHENLLFNTNKKYYDIKQMCLDLKKKYILCFEIAPQELYRIFETVGQDYTNNKDSLNQCTRLQKSLKVKI